MGDSSISTMKLNLIVAFFSILACQVLGLQKRSDSQQTLEPTEIAPKVSAADSTDYSAVQRSQEAEASATEESKDTNKSAEAVREVSGKSVEESDDTVSADTDSTDDSSSDTASNTDSEESTEDEETTNEKDNMSPIMNSAVVPSIANLSNRIGNLPIRIVLLGPPGVGKGTYSSYLKKAFGVPHISTGDMIRSEIFEDTALGREFKSYANQGILVSDELVSKIAEARLTKPDILGKGYILDGYPRTIPQAKHLQMFPDPPNLVMNLILPEKHLIQKLSGRRVCSNKKCGKNYNVEAIKEGEYDMPPILPKVNGKCDDCKSSLMQRDDDVIDVVKKRLQIYLDETAPLIEFYTKLGILRTFEAKKGFADIHKLEDSIISSIHDITQNKKQ